LTPSFPTRKTLPAPAFILAAALALTLAPSPFPGASAALAQKEPSAPRQAQAPAQGQETPQGSLDAQFRAEPPLTAAEIPIAIEALRLDSRQASDSEIDRLAAANKVTKRRLDFIVTKVSAAVVLIARPQEADRVALAAGSRLALPSEAELELVRARYDELKEYFPDLK
jgi:hypothetical protein